MPDMFDVSSPDGLIHLYEDGAFSRRELIAKLKRHTGSAAKAVAILSAAGLGAARSSSAEAACGCPDDVRVPEDSPDIEAQMVEYAGQSSSIFAYLVRPAAQADPQPGIVVIHENQGLTEYIKDVTRRVARAGYVGLGVDLLSRLGGTPQFKTPEERTAAYQKVGGQAFLEDLLSSVEYFKTVDRVKEGSLGSVGFCAGGLNSFNLAVNSPDISAAVSFYPGGLPPTFDAVEKLAGPYMGIFPELDRGTTPRMPALVSALLEKQKRFEMHVYQGTNHAFHNDTGPRYDRAAACDAWAQTTAFFNRNLRKA